MDIENTLVDSMEQIIIPEVLEDDEPHTFSKF
jgi:hypothetical protein